MIRNIIIFSILASACAFVFAALPQECQNAKTNLELYKNVIAKYLAKKYDKAELQDALGAIKFQLGNLNYELQQTDNPNNVNCKREWEIVHRALAKLVMAEKGITPPPAPAPAPAEPAAPPAPAEPAPPAPPEAPAT